MSDFQRTIQFESTFQAGVGSAGTTAEQLNNVASRKVSKEVVVKNTHASQNLFVGGTNVSATLNGYELGPNEEIKLEINNPADLWVVGSGAGTTYTWYAL